MGEITLLAILLLFTSSGTNGCFYDPFGGMSDTNTFKLSNTILSHLPKNFVNGQTTKYVILQNNGIKSIADGAFSGLPQLKVLDLSNNSLLPKDFFAFGYHDNLEAIILDNNIHKNASSADLEIKISHNYPKLKYISLRNVGLKTITSDFSTYFVSLSHLDLSNNNLNHKDVFTQLPKTVQSICVENTGLSVNSTISQNALQNIRNISLSNNVIGDIIFVNANGQCNQSNNQTLCLRLPNVKTFLAANCNVSSFVVKEKLLLEKLDLSSNRIFHLNNSLTHLVLLKHLNIGNNPLSTICDNCYSHLARLKVLNMDNVSSTFVEKFFDSIGHSDIEYLSISGNSLTELPVNVMQIFKTAVELNLSDNFLKSLDLDVHVIHHYNLKYVNASGNVIEDFKDIKMSEHFSLELLDMRKNPLTRFKKSSLRGIPGTADVLFSTICY